MNEAYKPTQPMEVLPPNDQILVKEVPPGPPTPAQLLYKRAVDCIGLDMSPRENERGCAESLYYVMKSAGMKVPNEVQYSTATFENWMEKHLIEAPGPETGYIRMSSTVGANIGHCGVEGNNTVISNNSRTFKWSDHWKKGSWIAYYDDLKKLKSRWFIPELA